MRTDDFDYDLPPELIAQSPIARGASRLLVLGRHGGQITHRRFPDLLEYLKSGDTLVLNDTRVIARRLIGQRESGQSVEVLVLRPVGQTDWEALVRPGKRLKPGSSVTFALRSDVSVTAEVLSTTPEGGRVIRFPSQAIRDSIADEGVAPIPPYIHETLSDEERYQTVFAQSGGSAAAPTAGLHFTEQILAVIEEAGVRIVKLTLHVGVDTFRPVKVDNLEDHKMHGERVVISGAAADSINAASGRIVAVGTTVARALESAARSVRCVHPYNGETRLFITPGFRFQVVDALLTNFHLPKSTLLALVSAFAGREKILAAYRAAIEERYRFYSFGDAMLIS